jgi:hypothetical protein
MMMMMMMMGRRLSSSLLVLLLACIQLPSPSNSQASNSTATTTTTTTSETTDEWYTKYPQYPDYCSTPAQMASREIPPFPHEDKRSLGETRIVHVTSILKHGARTIIGGQAKDNQCWEGYWENPETGVWNCPLTTTLAPPTPERVYQEEGNKDMKEECMILYDKTYDALKFHGGDKNVLNGTCQLGQLILQGYEQQIKNGQFLRSAYLYQEGSYDHDTRTRLFDVSEDSDIKPWDGHNLYLRSDDTQRTLMSGQILMRGLFEQELLWERFQYGGQFDGGTPTIPVHTADRSRDILGGFQEVCPKLDAIQSESETSAEYLKFYNSEESQQVREFMEAQLSHDQGLLDCLMTTVCTDRPLPERFGIYNPSPNSWFNRIAAYVSHL